MKNNYIHQTKDKGYSCCIAIALLNALIYYNKPLIDSLEDPKWELFVDKYCCRHGPVIGRNYLANEIGIIQVPIDRDSIKIPPVIISSYTKVGLHASLIVKIDKDLLTIINYHGHKGKLIEKIRFSELDFPLKGLPIDKHYYLKLRD